MARKARRVLSVGLISGAALGFVLWVIDVFTHYRLLTQPNTQKPHPMHVIRFALENSAVIGPVNAVAPQTLTNGDFSSALGSAMGRPSWLPAPARALKFVLGEMAEAMLLNGQRVEPAAAGKHGYRFQHPRIDSAPSSILGS